MVVAPAKSTEPKKSTWVPFPEAAPSASRGSEADSSSNWRQGRGGSSSSRRNTNGRRPQSSKPRRDNATEWRNTGANAEEQTAAPNGF